jgi:carbonic anhydrase
MQKLIRGIVDFRKDKLTQYREKFSALALEQNPDALFVACCDSRVVPDEFASTDPGDLFMIRNIGNLIPPYDKDNDNISVSAAIEFSMKCLQIRDIIICGHSSCGAMVRVLNSNYQPDLVALDTWLTNVIPSYEKFKSGYQINGSENLDPKDKLSQINVVQQLEHLKTYPLVRARMAEKTIDIHGWWFDLATANVYHYLESENRFVLIDHEEAERMLAAASSIVFKK